ncbi:calcium-binding protein [Neptunicoccus cionae]|uniref:calcium-binding protein n=1 Tax=Neptunicoccus cionae TaxID=2035344 RepID=UPI0011AE4F3E|nr:calcium-binding protein [Amylibacter cionae]
MGSAFKDVAFEFLVNTYTDDTQEDPSIDANPKTGGFQVVWESEGQDGSGLGVYAQNFHAGGNTLGSEFRINTVTEGDQENVDVAFNEDGNGSWVWQTDNIWFVTVNRDETPISGGIAENIRTRSKTFGFESEDGFYYNEDRVRYGRFDPDQEGQEGLEPRVISVGGDQFITVYRVNETFRNFSGLDVSEYTAYIPSVVPNNGQWSLRTVKDDVFPRAHTSFGDVAQVDDDTVVVASSMHSDLVGLDGVIQFQFMGRNDTQGLPLSLEERFVLEETSGLNGTALKPRIVVLSDGGIAVTWIEQDESSENEADWHFDVFFQVFNADGTPRGGRIAAHGDSKTDQTEQEITALKDGGFVITWTDEGGDGKGDAVKMARFDSKGIRLGDIETVNETTKGDQRDSAITTLKNGNVALVWESETGDGDGTGVFGKIFKTVNYANSTAQTLTGTDDGEKISSGGKNDEVFGEGGDDQLLGGGGADSLYGGDDNDTLKGGGGADKLYGDDGDDALVGQGGNDKMFGGDGNDNLKGNGGKDALNGDGGDDRLDGGGGNDVLKGGNENDSLFGGGGNDLLNGGKGNDVMKGGGGKDTFVFASDRDTIKDFEDDKDIVEFSKSLVKGGLTIRDLSKMVDERKDALIFDFGSGDRLVVEGIGSFSDFRDDIEIA